MKDVEVGNYYYDRGNYKAALLRYRDALEFKPRDAVATFRLAMVLEKLKEYPEAMARYQEYLSILKDGPSAGDARKALERLKSMRATAQKAPTAPQTTAKESAAPARDSKATEAGPR
jgi:tetratricopeptide (TPR) repeat protein